MLSLIMYLLSLRCSTTTSRYTKVWVLDTKSVPVSFHKPPFHPDIYRSEETDAQAEAEKSAPNQTPEARAGRAVQRMHAVSAGVRWKWSDGSQGLPVKRSNTRVIRWSDGSASLMIGREIWDVGTEGGQRRVKPFGGREVEEEYRRSKVEEGGLGGSGAGASQGRRMGPNASLQGQGSFGLGPSQGASSQQPQSQASQAPLPTQSQTPSAAQTLAQPAKVGAGQVSVLYTTDADNKVFVADSIVSGTLSLLPATPHIRSYQKRYNDATKATEKKARTKAFTDMSGVRPEKQLEETLKWIQGKQKLAFKNAGIELDKHASMPVWKGNSAQLREGSPGATKKRSGGGGGGRGKRAAYSSDEDMDDERPVRGGRGYAEGDYESDDFVVSSIAGCFKFVK